MFDLGLLGTDQLEHIVYVFWRDGYAVIFDEEEAVSGGGV